MLQLTIFLFDCHWHILLCFGREFLSKRPTSVEFAARSTQSQEQRNLQRRSKSHSSENRDPNSNYETALRRMAEGEEPEQVARDMGIPTSTVTIWKAQNKSMTCAVAAAPSPSPYSCNTSPDQRIADQRTSECESPNRPVSALDMPVAGTRSRDSPAPDLRLVAPTPVATSVPVQSRPRAASSMQGKTNQRVSEREFLEQLAKSLYVPLSSLKTRDGYLLN